MADNIKLLLELFWRYFC